MQFCTFSIFVPMQLPLWPTHHSGSDLFHLLLHPNDFPYYTLGFRVTIYKGCVTFHDFKNPTHFLIFFFFLPQ